MLRIEARFEDMHIINSRHTAVSASIDPSVGGHSTAVHQLSLQLLKGNCSFVSSLVSHKILRSN